MNQYLEFVKPTYIENWPKELARLTFAQTGLPLSRGEMVTLGGANIEFGEILRESYGKPSVAARDGLIQRMDEAIRLYPNGCFVRLGSRSPKDSMWIYEHGAQCRDGMQAWNCLTGCSERMHDDLSIALAEEYQAWIWCRQWVDMEPDEEFRCFQRGGDLIAISQYDYLNKAHYPKIVQNASGITWAIGQWYYGSEFRRDVGMKDVILDVRCARREAGNQAVYETTLVEINPFFDMTDPCLFSWPLKVEPVEFRFRGAPDENGVGQIMRMVGCGKSELVQESSTPK